MSEPIERLNAALSGRYRIEREIGQGGMATVYLADDLRHERKVALKVLKPELAAVVGAERFLSEIKTTANLQHPHILPLYDSGEADSFLYYVMPYVQGESLREGIDREKQLPVDEAVRIGAAVAGALAYAHEQGVVHRDIKPGNILMQAGQPMVGDFGIALAVGAAGGTRLTETGLSVGTPYYMSPEQATGDMDVGPASDIYALGAVIYELLIGDPPHMGSTAQAVLGKIIQGGPVSATAIRPSIPLNVDAAIKKALEKLPADRFTTAEQFAKALTDPGFRHGVEASAAAGGRLWKSIAVSATAAAAVFAAVAAWALLRPELPGPVLRFSLRMEVNQIPSEWMSISPDGTTAVMSYRDSEGAWKLWLRRFSDLEATAISGVEQQVNDPVISPDGTEVAFFEGGSTLKVAPLAGGLISTISPSANCCARWGDDGFIYYTSNDRNIQRVPLLGGTVEDVTTLGPDDRQHAYFQLLPGGDAAVFTVLSTPPRVEAIRLPGGERHVVTPGQRSYVTSTGHLVFASSDGRLLAAPFDADALEIVGAPVPVVDDLSIPGTGDPAYALSENGTLLYWSGPASSVSAEFVWVTREGVVSPVDPSWTFNTGTGNVGWSLSPDGSRLAFREMGGGDGGEIWTKEMDRGPLLRLTFSPAAEGTPRWSPDGRTVLFSSDRLGSGPDVWERRADGTGEDRLVLDAERPVVELATSPNGAPIVFRAASPPSRDILAQQPGVDSAATVLVGSTDFDEVSPALSPDGRWFAYTSFETGAPQVYVRPFPDVDQGRWQVSAGEGGSAPFWSHSGTELFYATQGGWVAARLDTRSGFRVVSAQEILWPSPVPPVSTDVAGGWYDVSPDDRRILAVRPATTVGEATVQPELILVQNFFEELRARVPR
ncbi:MAG: serine/threonine-protein kinase [Gemmatimonadetes bacterium]|nr:serine/threonine-protein kinase [Gemmatimonadota bacterium]